MKKSSFASRLPSFFDQQDEADAAPLPAVHASGMSALIVTDASAPTLLSSNPSDNAGAVAANGNIVLTFSEGMIAGGGNIVISDGSAQTVINKLGILSTRIVGATDTRTISVTDTSQVSISGSTVTINPSANLKTGLSYSVTMGPGVLKDSAGNAYSGIRDSTKLNFVTSAVSDTTAPTLVSSSPADNASSVATAADIVLTFSEAVQSGSGDIVISDGVDTRTISVLDESQVSISGSTLTISPSYELLVGSTYSVQMANGVVKDLNGNGFAGILNDTTLDFQTTTSDAVAPTIVSATPGDNDSGVLVDANIVIKFNEKVRPGAGNITITDGSDVRTISVNDTGQVTFSGNTVTVNPGADLNPNTSYWVTIAGGSILDVIGNSLADISNPTIYNFTMQDTIAPTASIVVADSVIGSGETPQVTITFSEAITGFDDSMLASLSANAGTLSGLSGSGSVWYATLTPSALTSSSNSVVTLDFSDLTVLDMAGNQASGTSTSNTYSVDTIAPTAVSVSTDDIDLKAGETANITVTFSEAVSNLDATDFTIGNGALSGLGTADGGVTWTATFTPSPGVDNPTNTISVDATGIVDGAGNAGTGSATSGNYGVATVVPTATVDAAIAMTDSGTSSTDYITKETAQNVSGTYTGTLGVNDFVEVSLDNGSTWNNATAGANVWSLAGVIAASSTIIARVSNTDGNGSTAVNQAYVLDTTAPTFSGSAPVSGGVLATVSDNIVLTFSETIAFGAGTLKLYTSVGAEVASNITVSGTEVTIDPNADLSAASSYYVQATADAIADVAGVSFVGLTTNTDYVFTTPA